MSRPTRADAGGRAYLDLQNRARREGRPTQELLVLYALERFLARLAVSPYADAFILKGGLLLAAFGARRATVDGDLLATRFPNEEHAVLTLIREVVSAEPDNADGVVFRPETARTRVIREENLYTGVRVTMQTSIATATVKIQLDVNFGDPVTPAARRVDYPTLREEHHPIRILGYPMATVVAEKLCTAIDLGDANSRIRDYADIWILTDRHDLQATDLRAALIATASHRAVSLRPLAAAVGDLAVLRGHVYKAFLTRVEDDTLSLPSDLAHLLADVISFADPLLSDLPLGTWSSAARRWDEPHSWQPRTSHVSGG